MLLEIFCFLLALWLYKSTRKPDKFPAGPLRFPVLGGLPHMALYAEKGNQLQSMQNLVKKYGKVFGFYMGSEKLVVISDFDLVVDLFKRDTVVGRPSMEPYNETRPGHKFPGLNGRVGGIVFSMGRYWHDQRQFTIRHLRDFGFGKSSMEDLLQAELEKLCHKFTDLVGTDLDLTTAFNVSVANSVWSILTGERLELDDPKLNEVVRLINVFGREVNMSPPIPVLLPHPSLAKLPYLRDISFFTLVKESMDKTLAIIRKAISEHQQTVDFESSPRDFIDVYLKRIQDETDSTSSFFGQSGVDVLTNVCVELLLAGMETTSTTLSWAFFFMAKYPELQKRAQQEIDQVIIKNMHPTLNKFDFLGNEVLGAQSNAVGAC